MKDHWHRLVYFEFNVVFYFVRLKLTNEQRILKATMDNVSVDLEQDLKNRLMNDSSLQKSIEERDKLPVSKMKSQIMNAVTENRVIIIRGNTGCGKTTQVI